jgi:hypothetical protein
VVLCEGYDDRSFWKGWLLHRGCTDPTEGGRKTVNDAWGRPVRGKGRYLFRTPSGSDVVVQPYHGRDKARKAAEEYLGGRQAYRPSRVVLNLDCDGDDGSARSAEDQVLGIAGSLGATERGPGPFVVGASMLHSVIWRCPDPHPTPGVPGKQTLERLVSAAIRAATPDRGASVERWLDDAPRGFKLPKSYGYSYFAKWFADHGEAHFYEWIWRDEGIVRELRSRLESQEAWQVVEELVGD